MRIHLRSTLYYDWETIIRSDAHVLQIVASFTLTLLHWLQQLTRHASTRSRMTSGYETYACRDLAWRWWSVHTRLLPMRYCLWPMGNRSPKKLLEICCDFEVKRMASGVLRKLCVWSVISLGETARVEDWYTKSVEQVCTKAFDTNYSVFPLLARDCSFLL